MRKGIAICTVLIITALIFAALPYNVSAGDTYPEDMVSYWKLDEGEGTTATDSVDGNHGTLINGPGWTTGQVGSALSFDGSNDYVGIPDSASLDITDAITLEAWVYPTYSPWSGMRIIDKMTVGYSDSYLLDTYPNNKVRMITNPSVLTTTERIPTNAWTHIVATFDSNAGVQRIYLNGILKAEKIFTPGLKMTLNNRPVRLGANSYLSGNWFRGIMDEVAIYDRAVSAEEIEQHYENGLEGNGYDYIEPIEATVDIDPNTLNLKSKGKWVTAYIDLAEGYDVEDIDTTTVMLEQTISAAQSEIQDDQLMVKFDRQELIAMLSPGTVELTVTGELDDGTPFFGSDTINVIKKGK